MKVDLAPALLAAAAVVLALLAVLVVRQRLRPRRTVTVRHDFQLIQPLFPLGRYTFRLEVFYEVEERGERRTARQGAIEMKFRRGDHPEIFEWCRTRISSELTRHGELATRLYPGAEVQVGEGPTVPELEARTMLESS